jgi:hypothetical protein
MIFLHRALLDSSEIPAVVKSFLYALNSYTDRRGYARVRRCKIAKRMGMSERSVSRAIRFCKELRLIAIKDNGFHRAPGYWLLCGQVAGESGNPQASQSGNHKESSSISKNVNNGNCKKKLSRQEFTELNMVAQDIGSILGSYERNKHFYFKIAKTVGYDAAYQALSWIKESIYDNAVNSPPGLFTWYLRQQGYAI